MSPLKAVILDWAGTVVDYGSRAPMGAFVEVFARFGIDLTIADAREPMGLPKIAHIQALGRQPRVAAAWQAKYGRPFTDEDAREVHDVFVPLNAAVVGEYAQLIPGALETVAALRERGLKIGSTTGYTREIMARLLPLAAAQGYTPDNLVCAGDLADGRPTPLMMYRCFADLGVFPPSACVKVDDTVPGILEGRAAGTWTVGVSLTGNEVGLSEDEVHALSSAERQRLNGVGAGRLRDAGANYVVDGIGDLLAVIETIEGRLRAGERPPA